MMMTDQHADDKAVVDNPWKKYPQPWNIATAMRLIASNGNIPVDPEQIAAGFGIKIERVPTEQLRLKLEDGKHEDIKGLIIKESESEPPVIYLNEDNTPEQQKFTVAHELGHFWVHRKELTFSGYPRDELASQGDNPRETWANGFGAELIMPADYITKAWVNGDAFEQIRQELAVSRSALKNRFSTLHLSTEE